MSELFQLYSMDNPISDFLNCYLNERTADNYRIALTKFVGYVSGGASDDIRELDSKASLYLKSVREDTMKFSCDMRKYSAYLMQEYSPAYAALNFNILTMWFEDLGMSIPTRQKHRLMQYCSTTRSIRNEAEMTRNRFFKIYSAMPRWCSTLLLVLIGSGMRIGETMMLEKSDIDWHGSRPLVVIRSEITKTKETRITYLTREAAVKLKEYLSFRDDSDPRLFPYSTGLAEYYMRKAVDSLGYQKNSKGLRPFHFHMTRKWFLSRFSLVASRDVAECLVGHKGYLSDSYRRYSKRELLSQFIKAEPYISILGDTTQQGKLPYI